MRPFVRAALMATGGIVLGLVFLAYLRPEMAFTLANQLWSCF